MLNALNQLTLRMASPPALITVARSVEDGYTKPDVADEV
jgi:hypothetical protein